MALQFSTAYRNALLDQFETTAGQSEVIKLFTGSAPANCAAADSGTLLATFTLAASGDWSPASGGSKALASTPLSVNASGTGTAGYFRWYASNGTTCHMQGSVTLSGGGGDLTVDNTNLQAGQQCQVTGFTMTAPGA